jgi:hypothetical protein
MNTDDTNSGAYTATPPAAESPQLNLVDLQNLRAVVDVAARRGAFGAAEMASVGAVFTKLDSFLNANLPADQSQPPAAQ